MSAFTWHPRHRDRLSIALLFLCAAVLLFWLVNRVAHYLQLVLNGWGWFNLSVFTLLSLWYFADVIFTRRWIYALFGFEEPPLTPQIRLWRRMALLAISLGTIADCVIDLAPVDPASTIPAAALPSITALMAAFLASLGWMFTAFEKERTDRAAHTLAAARAQLSESHVLKLYSQMTEMVRLYSRQHNLRRSDPFPVPGMALTLASLPADDRPEGRASASLERATDQFLDQLDQIALAVREGFFDFRAIRLALRQRFVRIAFLFSPYIREQTAAEQGRDGRWRATERTWEHYLWLVQHLEILDSDEIQRASIVLPPRVPKQGKPKPAVAESLELPPGLA